MYQLWRNLEILHEHACRHACIIVIEWPRYCNYWKLPMVRRFIDKYSFRIADFDGCMFGLKNNKKDMPIKKPWRIATNSNAMHHLPVSYVVDTVLTHRVKVVILKLVKSILTK